MENEMQPDSNAEYTATQSTDNGEPIPNGDADTITDHEQPTESESGTETETIEPASELPQQGEPASRTFNDVVTVVINVPREGRTTPPTIVINIVLQPVT